MKLNEKYNSGSFIDFLHDFLPNDFNLNFKDILINRERCKEIIKAKILGYCESLDLYVLEIEHNRNNDPRIAIATDAFKVLADHWIHKALVVFKNRDSDNYRLSLLTITLDINDKDKIVKKYSNARRFSFYLGVGAKVNTPEQQLIKNGKIKNIQDLQTRFSIEVVNDEFYLRVAEFFDKLTLIGKSILSLPEPDNDNLNIRKSFAVRLIGRLMFCWFLRQKESQNGKLIPNDLLSSSAVSSNYYHNILERLFFEVLNTSIESRAIRTSLFDLVPYLNGGLFTPQKEDYYELDKSNFTSKYINSLNIDDIWFYDFFKLLETYNFTIDENTVFDQELSIDPEMLGRIFENLLDEINPEKNHTERDRTASFYTPRQIVDYMVDQSLLKYFNIKTNLGIEKLEALISYDLIDDIRYPLNKEEKKQVINAIDKIKILDPACGSGAFPIGMLQKIVYILQQIDPDCIMWLDKKLENIPDIYKQKIISDVRSNPYDYTRKLDIIKNSIFGVDIQPIAVDVSRLRCFLTLVVEAEINDSKINRGIESLPNLDFKFVCANTLIGLPSSNYIGIGLFEDHSGIQELSTIMSEYFSCNNERKNEIKLKFTSTQKNIIQKTFSTYGKENVGELTLKLTDWDPFTNKLNNWFDSEWMFGIQEKFDIIIGNPPYGISVSGDYRLALSQQLGKVPDYEIYYYFIEVSKSLLKEKGIKSFIIPNTFLFNVYAANYRKKLLNDWRIELIIDCTSFKLFKAATVHNVITVFVKENILNQEIGYKSTEEANTFLDLINRKTSFLAENILLMNNSNWGLVFKLPKTTLEVVSSIKSQRIKIEDIFPEISQGLIAYDKYTGQDDETIKNRVFHYTTKTKDTLKEWLWGEDVTPYKVKWNNNEYIDYCKGIANPRDPKFFLGKRVLVREITNPKIYAGYTESEQYHDPSIIVILDNNRNILPLLGILNSKLATFFHFNSSPKATKGSFPKILVKDIKEFPIPNWDKVQEISEYSRQMIDVMSEKIASDSSNKKVEIESKIDEIVFNLYELDQFEKDYIVSWYKVNIERL